MCGHVGIAGNLIATDEAVMKRLFLYDYFRGPDSTGLATIRNTNEVKIAKIASHPLNLFDLQRFKDAINALPSHVFIGHNRAATRGVVNDMNAHPFQYDHIVGAHNGTLSTATVKRLEDKLGEKFEVDSKAIFASIAKLGIDETVAMFQKSDNITKCADAWALVWFDLNQKTLNFLRNDERPFWYAYSKCFKKVYWASEWGFIRAACEQGPTPQELYQQENTGYKFFETQVDTLYTYDIMELKTKGTLPKPKVRPLAGKEAPYVYTAAAHAQGSPFTGQRHNPNGGRQNHSTTPSTTSRGGTPSTMGNKPPSKHTVVSLFGDDKDPMAGLYDEYEFIKTAGTSCAWCDKDLDIRDRGITIFEGIGAALCAECSGDHTATGPVRVYAKNLQALVG